MPATAGPHPMKQRIRDKLDNLADRLQELDRLLATSEAASDMDNYRKLTREHAEITPVVGLYRDYCRALEDETSARELLSDPEMKELAAAELESALEAQARIDAELQAALLPRDPNDERNIFLEIRAGTGGDEAALFAGDLFRMYTRFAERHGWKLDMLSSSPGAAGGWKEIIVLIEGKDVYSRLKWESGVHRVQRVPATEAQGRIHTSAATVAVLPEAEEVDVKIEDKDVRYDVQRASGSGGQSVNTTDSAVRLTHLPTNIVVYCQDEKSQHKNKAKALKVLRSRLYDHQLAERQAAERDARRTMVGSGDRSEKVRTYNFPQDRVTDHRIGLTKHNLPAVMDGELDDIIEALRANDQADALKAAT